ncbi:hypothetical protein P4O66_000327 [Electrophorus voltai]|uniref:Uncharacterized protein n=1 Tax=Electrophorus voltai TaxID=2609070 RepID=A0AAD9DYI4_9TELE|nr:hypothetical protein P4O66_000327 [Electrophorus voltai]
MCQWKKPAGRQALNSRKEARLLQTYTQAEEPHGKPTQQRADPEGQRGSSWTAGEEDRDKSGAARRSKGISAANAGQDCYRLARKADGSNLNSISFLQVKKGGRNPPMFLFPRGVHGGNRPSLQLARPEGMSPPQGSSPDSAQFYGFLLLMSLF